MLACTFPSDVGPLESSREVEKPHFTFDCDLHVKGKSIVTFGFSHNTQEQCNVSNKRSHLLHLMISYDGTAFLLAIFWIVHIHSMDFICSDSTWKGLCMAKGCKCWDKTTYASYA